MKILRLPKSLTLNSTQYCLKSLLIILMLETEDILDHGKLLYFIIHVCKFTLNSFIAFKHSYELLLIKPFVFD
jgi:hypothetical protein